eukprot:3018961-Rhodomonas_salina.2
MQRLSFQRLGYGGLSLCRCTLLASTRRSPGIQLPAVAQAHISRSFSTTASSRSSDLDSMSMDDLKKLVTELRAKQNAQEAAGDIAASASASTITGAPENYMPRPTKGEASDLKSTALSILPTVGNK